LYRSKLWTKFCSDFSLLLLMAAAEPWIHLETICLLRKLHLAFTLTIPVLRQTYALPNYLFWLFAKSRCQFLAIWARICCEYSHIFVIFLKTKEGTAKLSINLSSAWTQLSSDVCFFNSTYFLLSLEHSKVHSHLACRTL
jgi:hypothetical protein